MSVKLGLVQIWGLRGFERIRLIEGELQFLKKVGQKYDILKRGIM